MTALPLPGAGDAFYVVDVMGMIHRVWHVAKKSPPEFTRRGERCELIRGVVRMLARLIRDRDPALLALATEGRGDCWRRAYWPPYKAGHVPLPDECRQQIKRLWSVVQLMRIPILWAPTFEADDAIAAATQRARGAGFHVVIVSRDKDLAQLAGQRVTCWDGDSPGRVMGPPEVEAKWGVKPDRLGDLLALAGDESDGVPGIKGIGTKVGAELLQAFGYLEAVLTRGPLECRTPNRRKLLRAGAADARLSRELVGLRVDAPIKLDLAEARVGGADAPLSTAFHDLRLPTLGLDMLGPKRWRRGAPEHFAQGGGVS